MKKSIVVLLHIGFWVCYLLIIAIMLAVYYRSSSHAIDQTGRIENAFESLFLFAFFPSFITFYGCYILVFPKYLQQKRFFFSIISGILISLSASVIAYILMRYLIESGQLLDMDKGGINGRSTAIRTISGIFGTITSGNNKTGSLFTTHISGAELITGGAFGPEGTIQATILWLFVSIILMIVITKQNKLIKPSFKNKANLHIG